MIDLEDKSLQCPIAGCPGVLDYLPLDGCFVCPTCQIELWGEDATRKVTTFEAKEVYRLQQRTQALLRKPGATSGASGRKREEKKKHLNPNIYGVKPHWRQYDE